MSQIKVWAVMFIATLLLGAGFGINEKLKGAAASAAGSFSDVGLTLKDDGAAPLVATVKAGSLADKSGLKAGDRITAVNRVKVNGAGDVENRYEGEGTTLIVVRDGKSVYPNIVMGKAPPPEVAASAPAGPVLGLEVQDMMGMYPSGVRAPMAMNPTPGELADKAGIKAQEWIVKVNGTEIATAADYKRAVAGDGPLVLTVLNVDVTPRQTRDVKIR